MHKSGLTLFAILFVTLWSSGWTASHYLVTDSPVLSILSARYVLVVAMLLILVTVLRQWQAIPPGDFVLHLLIGALCHALYLLGSMSAFALGVSAALVAFVNTLQPIATGIFAGILIGERTTARHGRGLLLGALSVALIVSDSYTQTDVSSFALTLPFLAMLALCAGLLLNRRLELQANASRRKSQPVMLLLLIHTVGALLVILPLAAFNSELHWQFTKTQWSAIVWLAIVVSLGSYALLLFLLRHISAIRVTSLTYLVPPSTMLQSYLFFDETLSLMNVVALCAIGVAVYMILTDPPASATPILVTTGSARAARNRLEGILQRSATTKSF